eukprot:scaffold66717_cov60-Phaeocystis_antarctica.AAC.1
MARDESARWREMVGDACDGARCARGMAQYILPAPPTPFAATLKRSLVPERVGRVRQAPCPPGFGIHQPDPWARAGPVGTAPRAHSDLSGQTRQKRKAQTAPRTRGSKWFPVYPPTPLRNPLNS